ncbi:MAG: restriction endonuclease subunit S [Parcubacteria group bacterium]
MSKVREKLKEEWIRVKLADISQIKRGASPRPIGDPRYFSDKGRGWIRISDVSKSYKYLKRTKQYLSELGEERSVKVDRGDLIMSICATVGKPIMIKIPACIHDGFVLFDKLHKKKVDTEFLFYALLNSENTFLGSGQTGSQKNLNTTIVGNTEILLPPIYKQKIIAEILSKVDEDIEKTCEVIKKSEKIKKGLMRELFTKGIGHKKLKKTKLGMIPEEWEVLSLGEMGIFSKGKGISKKELIPTGLPAIRYGEIYTKHNFIIKKFYSFISKKTASESISIKKGDILFTGSGETPEEIGKSVAYLGDEKAYAGGDIIIFSPSKGNSLFLSYLFNSPLVRNDLTKLGQGNSVVHMYKGLLEKIKVAIPNIDEQNNIAGIISKIDEKIDGYKKTKSKLETLKKGLMQDLLSAKNL